jgi:hypothetical protein
MIVGVLADRLYQNTFFYPFLLDQQPIMGKILGIEVTGSGLII